jgi:hypothetical protein
LKIEQVVDILIKEIEKNSKTGKLW